MKHLLIYNAIIWATVILLSAILFKDHENYNIFFIVIIGLSTISNGFLSKFKKTQNTCIK